MNRITQITNTISAPCRRRSAKVLLCIVPLSILATAVSACSDTIESEQDNPVEQASAAVVGGKNIPLAKRTSLEKAVVRIVDLSTGGWGTATLVRPDWVLTARHCVAKASGLPTASVEVQHDNGTKITSSEIFLHPDPVVDAALIHLPNSINAGQPASVPLFTGSDADVVSKTVTIYGYGGTYPNLSRVSATVQSVERDGSMQGTQRYNNRYLRITGTTPGDSGGPAFRNGQIVSVTGGDLYKAYAKVFRNWANSILSPATYNHIGGKTSFAGNLGPSGTIMVTGDVNGDGYADIVQFNQNSSPAGSVYVVPGTASGFGTMVRWHASFSTGAEIPALGDVDGDGKDDLIKFRQSDAKVFYARSLGSSFSTSVVEVHSGFSYPGETPRVGDVNGDGRADIVTFVHHANWGDVWVSLSCGKTPGLYPQGCSATQDSKFGSRILWNSGFSLLNEIPYVGDMNGDGLADLITFNRDAAAVAVALTPQRKCTQNSDCGADGGCWAGLGICPGSFGQSGGTKTFWASGNGPYPGETPVIADMNGDGKMDVADFETTTASGRNGWFGVMRSSGSGLSDYEVWSKDVCYEGQACLTADIGREGRADVINSIYAGTAYFARSLGQ